MITATITIGAETTVIEVAGSTSEEAPAAGAAAGPDPSSRQRYELPRGMMTLHRAHITADPPLPQNLTNAIGDMVDHLDDAGRELPALADAGAVVLGGAAALAMVAVEIGSSVRDGDFVLERDAAEDVFRTLATEPSHLRRHNPGLSADLVDAIPAGCCAVVAVLRSLKLDAVTVPAR